MAKPTHLFLGLALLLAACEGNDKKKSESATVEITDVADDSEADGNPLVDSDGTVPEGFTFERKDFEGIGTMDMPMGSGWTMDDNTYYNKQLDMTVKIQSQETNNIDVVKEYTQSHFENNLRDAEGFREIKREMGQVNGYVASMLDGTFNNGQPYFTRDYLFFTPEKSVILQVRVNEENREKLHLLADYMAISLKKQ